MAKRSNIRRRGSSHIVERNPLDRMESVVEQLEYAVELLRGVGRPPVRESAAVRAAELGLRVVAGKDEATRQVAESESDDG